MLTLQAARVERRLAVLAAMPGHLQFLRSFEAELHMPFPPLSAPLSISLQDFCGISRVLLAMTIAAKGTTSPSLT